MKKSIKYLVCASLLTISVQAQKQSVLKADDKYERYDYVDAIKTYEKVFERGYKSADMLKRLGNSYYFQADLDKSAKWYGELFKTGESVEPEYYYRYAQSLKAVKDYTKADEMMAEFEKRNKNDIRSKLSSSQKNYLDIIAKNSGRYTIDNAGINSKESDYGSAFYGKKVVFATARDTGGMGKRSHTWNGQSFTNLYQVDLAQDGSVSNPKRFSKKLNSKYHESTPVFTKDSSTVYFTRNNYNNGRKGYDANKAILLKLYKATINGDNWDNVEELPFNSDTYSVAHPALSPDEKTLYFSSDMPGTLGLSDIFKVSIDGGSYGTPENLGKEINTEGRETFPFITPENEMYFASDGQPGLGGLDIYYAKSDGKGGFHKVQNVGEPINSSKDDFSFLIDTNTKYGFLTSNREGGLGSDDIYKFKELEKIKDICEKTLTGTIKDELTGEPLAYAKVTLSDENFNELKTVIADAKGNYDFGKIECEKKYNVKGEKEGYETVEQSFVTDNKSGKEFVPLKQQNPSTKLREGIDLGPALGIKMIYFDLDKSYIRPDAAVELSKILYVLEQYPAMELDIRSHTDCRQTYDYNMRLSDRRAKSTIQWLVDHGISASRLTGRGYGESQLTNNCPCEPTNASSCSEEEHQLNRRSEFIIKKIK